MLYARMRSRPTHICMYAIAFMQLSCVCLGCAYALLKMQAARYDNLAALANVKDGDKLKWRGIIRMRTLMWVASEGRAVDFRCLPLTFV